MLNKTLPLIELKINPDENSFVEAVSLVQSPAVELDFIAFAKQTPLQFSTNEEKRELLGIAMLAGQNIYRNHPELGEYMCVFSKDTIREISQVFARKSLFNKTNLEHSLIPGGSYIYQSYLTDDAKGIKAPKGFENVPDGSWVIGMKVTDDEVWQKIKSGDLAGFSVEGIFQMIDTKKSVTLSKELTAFEQALQELEDLTKLADIN